MTKKTLNNIFFLAGVACVVVMLLTFDISFKELWYHLCTAGYWLIPVIGVWIFIYGLNALAWRAIIKGNTDPDEHVGFWRIYKLTISGYALNYATPVGGLGGEPYRILELTKDISKEHATSSVILYAMMHFFAHFWFWFSSIFIYIALVLIGDLPINTTISITLGAIALFCMAAFWLFQKGYKGGLVINVMKFLSKIPGLKGWSKRFTERHRTSLENIDKQIAALHSQDKRAFYTSFFFEYMSRVVQSLEIMFMLLMFDIDCGGGFAGYTLVFLHSILILSFTTLCANLIGFLPMQLGVQEGGFMLSIPATIGHSVRAALSPQKLIAGGFYVSLICGVREILWILIGIVLMKMWNKEGCERGIKDERLRMRDEVLIYEKVSLHNNDDDVCVH